MEDLPATAQVAFQQADVVAWNVWAGLTGQSKPLAFNYLRLGEMLTLGELEGSIWALDGLLAIEGRAASLARRLVYVLRMPTAKQRLSAARSWVQGRVRRFKSLVGMRAE
jgi:demethylphylloquinone reductase